MKAFLTSKLTYKDIFGDSDEELSSDDENAEELTQDVASKITETIKLIREKDPRIYHPNFRPFQGIVANEGSKPSKKPKEKEITYKDMVRERILQGKFEEEEEQQQVNSKVNSQPSYIEEQEEVKKAFKKALEAAEKEEVDDESEFQLEVAKNPVQIPELKPKPNSSKKEAEDDAFLWKYINEKSWLNESKPHILPNVERLIEEDDEELDRQEDFEQKFQFRFQEPNATEIVSHTRKVEGSLRRQENQSSRKRERINKLKREREEKKEKLEELNRLKNLRRELIQDELKKAFSKAGSGVKIAFDAQDIDEDFDPKKWDEKMSKIFGDDYYQQEDEELARINKDSQKNDEASESEKDKIDAERENQDEEEDVDEQKEEQIAEMIRKIAEEKVDEEFSEKEVLLTEEGKFRYRTVPVNDYGIDELEILRATNSELNAFVSLKRMAPYVEQEWHASAKHRRRFREKVKEREKLEREREKSGNHKVTKETPKRKLVKKLKLHFGNKKLKKEDATLSVTKAPVSGISTARLKSFGK